MRNLQKQNYKRVYDNVSIKLEVVSHILHQMLFLGKMFKRSFVICWIHLL